MARLNGGQYTQSCNRLLMWRKNCEVKLHFNTDQETHSISIIDYTLAGIV